tara:strand:+ start:832 stop:1695 length:864 start_codon:yes stop_codon:yes gene_type:complete
MRLQDNKEQIFLPEKFNCPTLISFSGGRTSAYMLYKILEAYNGTLPKDAHVVFANTGKEVEETLKFIKDCELNWNVKVRWLELDIHEERPVYRNKEVSFATASRNGEPFEQLIKRRKMLPNVMMRFCTTELKVNVMKRFMTQNGYSQWANVIGLRYDEPRRVAKQRKQNKNGKMKWTSVVPLYDYKVMLEDVSTFWKNNDFDLGLPSHSGQTRAGNCDLCFLKGTKILTDIIKEKPELADWWKKQENVQGNTFNKERSYNDLTELSKIDAKQIEIFDDDSRSCFCHD